MYHKRIKFKVGSIKCEIFRNFEPIFQNFRWMGQKNFEGKVLSGRLKSLICGPLG